MHRAVFSTLSGRKNITVSATLLAEGYLNESQCTYIEIPVTIRNSEKTLSHYSWQLQF